MHRPSPLQPCRRADPCSPPFTALRNAHPRYAVSIRRAPPCWIGLGCPSLTDCGSFKRLLSGPFDGLTRSDLGRIEPLSLAWWCDRLRREGDTQHRATLDGFRASVPLTAPWLRGIPLNGGFY